MLLLGQGALLRAGREGGQAVAFTKPMPVLQPMVLPPKPWGRGEQGGYYVRTGEMIRSMHIGRAMYKRLIHEAETRTPEGLDQVAIPPPFFFPALQFGFGLVWSAVVWLGEGLLRRFPPYSLSSAAVKGKPRTSL